MKNLFDQFCYVDAHFEHVDTGQRTRWVRLLARDVQTHIVKRAKNTNCFASFQRYQDAVRPGAHNVGSLEEEARPYTPKKHGQDPEPNYTPKTEEEREGEADALLDDRQVHYHGLCFDFDADPFKKGSPVAGLTVEQALKLAQEEAYRVGSHFQQRFELNDAHVQTWFSGKKGFHIIIRPEIFDIQPHRHLTYITQKVALDLVHALELKTLDKTIYTVSRMWRIPNSIHPEVKRFKVELMLQELKTLPLDDILKLAQKPRRLSDHPGDDYLFHDVPASHVWPQDEYEQVHKVAAAASYWREYLELYEASLEAQRLKPRAKIVRSEKATEYPVCITDLLDRGPKPGGKTRNQLLVPMAAFFKDAGLDKIEAEATITDWTRRFYGEDKAHLRERIANGKSVLHSAYRSDKYTFSCRSILSCGSPSSPVACVGQSSCPWIEKAADQEPQFPPTLHLSEATRDAYLNTKVKVPIHVSGVGKEPFGYPRKIQIGCNPKKDKDGKDVYCDECPHQFQIKHGQPVKPFEHVFSMADPEILKLVNVPEPRVIGALKHKLKFPVKCHRARIETLEEGNLEELQVIPMVDHAQGHLNTTATDPETDVTRVSHRHVVRRLFAIGHNIAPNRKYMMEGHPYKHPDDQRIVFVSDSLVPAQNDIDQFKMTPELYRQLLIFQPHSSSDAGKPPTNPMDVSVETVKAKLEHIHADLEANVHQIGGRFDLACAVDLAYHSVIRFPFLGQVLQKGWFELLILGDSGSGKTTSVERIMRHYGLGELVAGEGAKRTGLVWNAQQLNGQWTLFWGKIPQNDKRLLVIDEFAGMDQEEIGKMTQLRSTGIASGQGVGANYETNARTRLVLLTNPRNGRSLAEFNYGIEAIRDLFDEHQDLRRTDLAVTAQGR
jgi:hypothetical protein